MPPPNEELSEVVEVNLARLVADAGKQLTAAHKQQAAQQQAQQQAQDPILQLRREEVAVKQAEVQRKTQKDQADATLQQAELMRKAQKDQVDAAIDAQRVETEQAGVLVQAAKDKVKVQADVLKESDKLDLEIFKAITNPPKGDNL